MRMRTRPQAAIENESAHYSLGSWLISWDRTHYVNGEALNACDIQGTRENVSNDIMEKMESRTDQLQFGTKMLQTCSQIYKTLNIYEIKECEDTNDIKEN